MFAAVTEEIVKQRHLLEDYIQRHPEFGTSFDPIEALTDAPEVAQDMAKATRLVGVGPMAAVAGAMAQKAGEAGIRAGAREAVIENGGDIYLDVTEPITIGLYPGAGSLAGRLAFVVDPQDTPLAICSSSGKMGHSQSLGQCDLATVVAQDTALADAAATQAANLVKTINDVDAALESINAIDGIDGILIVKEDHIGLVGQFPSLVKT